MEVTTDLTRAQKWMIVYSQAVSDSWMDDALRADLIRDPKGTLKRKYHYDLPSHITVKFVEVTEENFKDVKEFDGFDFGGNPSEYTLHLIKAPNELSQRYNDIHAPEEKMEAFCCCCCL